MAIRLDDPDWLFAELERRTPEPRGSQLTLLLPSLRFPPMHPLRKGDAPPRRTRLDQWRLQHKGRLTIIHDNPRICPPELPGQVALLRLPRAFSLDDGPGIRDRAIPDLEAVREGITVVRREHRLGRSWEDRATTMARLALAARDPDERLVSEEDLDELPTQCRDLIEVFRRAGLLRARHGLPPAPLATRPNATRRQRWTRPRDPFRSCAHCLAWSGDAKSVCAPCRAWAMVHPTAACRRCRRDLPVKDGQCRFCHVVLAENPIQDNPIDQLWFGGDLAVRLSSRKLRRFHEPRQRVAQRQAVADRETTRQISAHLVDPNQVVLVDLRRDWRGLDRAVLPHPTELAEQLLAEFDQHARSHSWPSRTRAVNIRVLRILLSWLGPYAPIHEADVHAVASMSTATSAARVIQYLISENLLIPDPARSTDADEAGVNRLLATLPQTFIPEVQAWVRVLRGNGGKPSPTMPWQSIRRYLGYLAPTLQLWGNHVESLRAITTVDVNAAIKAAPFQSARSLSSAIRSLFRALRRERLIFRDPARNISFPHIRKLPTPLPTDRLRGLLDRATNTAAKLAVALVAVHALYVEELRDLRLAQIDRSAGQMTLHRASCEHVVFLDELTLTLLAQWLRERVDRWPRSTNPHLFVSRQSAVDRRSVSRFSITQMFAPLGITPSQLRIDRLLDEAHHTADPVHLMSVFGITDTTAMKYTRAAHPDRFATGRTSP